MVETSMRVLDIDLDFFINEPAYRRSMSGNDRLPSEDYCPWPEIEVRTFLESQCGITVNRPIPGRVIEHHDEAFFFWRDLIQNRTLQAPFEVVHIDSHADLGFGDAGWFYLMGELLHKPLHERYFPKVGLSGLNPGNYLAFAIACRWLNSLTYVHHHRGGHDLMLPHFKDFRKETNIIELKTCRRTALNNFPEPNYESFGVIRREPEIPFLLVDWREYRDEANFDLVVLANSPPFTPAESDRLIPIINDYIVAI